jgi:hypothetical protein
MHKISLPSRVSHSTQLCLSGMKRNLAMGWIGVVSCVCNMKLFDLSILFVGNDFGTYVFCFVSLPSIDMTKIIYGLGFNSLGR